MEQEQVRKDRHSLESVLDILGEFLKPTLTKSGLRVFGFFPAGSTSKVGLTFKVGVLIF